MTDASSPFSTSGSAAALVDALEQQRDLYRQLKDLSGRQATLIDTGQTEQLLEVLTQRQGLVERLGQLQDQAAQLRQDWPRLSQTLAQEQRDRVNRLVDEVESLLSAIIDQDEHDRQRLQRAKQRITSELGHVAQTGQAVRAYRAAPGQATPRFTDHRG